MRAFIEFLLHRRILILALTGILVIGGVIAWTRLPIDAFPDVTNVQVMILAEAPGFSAVDVEQQVTYPIEQQMGGVPKVTQVRSLSKSGFSQVVVVFQDDVDIYFARQQVFERLQSAKGSLPGGIEPELGPISTGLGEIFQYTLEGEGLSPMELRTIQDYIVTPQLKPIAGVNEVNSFGGFVRQYHVLVDPDRLRARGLSVGEVTAALGRSNANALLLDGGQVRHRRHVAIGIMAVARPCRAGHRRRVKPVVRVPARQPTPVPVRPSPGCARRTAWSLTPGFLSLAGASNRPMIPVPKRSWQSPD